MTCLAMQQPAQQPPELAPNYFGIDLCRKGDRIPDGVASWRVLIAWGVAIAGLMIVASVASRMTGAGRLWGVPSVIVVIFSIWALSMLLWPLYRAIRNRIQSQADRSLPRVMHEAWQLPLREEDVPETKDAAKRLRLVGTPQEIARVLALVQPRTRFEPVIVRPSGAASFPVPNKKNDVISTTKLAMPTWKRIAIIAIIGTAAWGVQQAMMKLLSIRVDLGILAIFVILALSVAASEWLVPTFLRIVPQRLDIMTFVPWGFGDARKAGEALPPNRVLAHSFDLTTATIEINLKAGAARIEDTQRVARPLVYVRAGSLIMRNPHQEAQVWASLLNAALCHVPAPPLPMDRLTD